MVEQQQTIEYFIVEYFLYRNIVITMQTLTGSTFQLT